MAYVLILWRNDILFDVMAHLFYGVHFNIIKYFLMLWYKVYIIFFDVIASFLML